MKNKKGFTLIELLAVILILILVLLIAINKTRQSSNNARKNTIKANALNYIKAVNNQAGLDVLEHKIFKSSVFNVEGLEQNGVKVLGTKPSDALVCINNYEIDNACLEYNGFKVIYNNGSIQNIKRGTCNYNDFSCNVKPSYFFEYTGSYQAYTAPRTGTYRIDLWGAQGGTTTNASGGKGAYTSGVLSLNEGETIYIYVGGQGSARSSSDSAGTITGGWNGGAIGNKNRTIYSQANSSGGGATDIRLVSGEWNDATSLNSRIMVAAGGGGTYEADGVLIAGGAGGALKGAPGVYVTDPKGYSNINPKGGTQTTGGQGVNDWNYTSYSNDYLGGFGVGGTGANSYGGGGGGYWGGASGTWQPGAGGSSYISGYTGCVAITSSSSRTAKEGCDNGTQSIACSYHYSGKVFKSTIMKSGNELMPNYDNTSTMTGNEGNGYAAIYENYFLADSPSKSSGISVYDYTGHEEVFTASKTGKYKLEAWGAQGGDANSTYVGGYGGFSVGYVTLNEGQKIYINVGGKGSTTTNGYTEHAQGGYNGGGNNNVLGTLRESATQIYAGGGGATSITLTSGLLNSFGSDISSIIIVAGGGGGAEIMENAGDGTEYLYTSGGSAGGYISTYSNPSKNWETAYTCYGATQSQAGYCTYNNATYGAGSLGQGGSCVSGGGGGYYGGNGGTDLSSSGGTGYIGHSSLTDKAMYCYNCTESNELLTKTISVTCNSVEPTENCSKKGNGYAKITFIG